MPDATNWIGVLGGGGLLAVLVEVWRTWREGKERRAEMSAKAATAPVEAQSLLLGNVDQAVASQTKIITDLRAHAAWQETQIVTLRAELVERDAQIRELAATAAQLRVEVDHLSRQIRAMQGQEGE